MDKKIANNIIVGIFVLIGIAVFVFVLFTVGGGKGILSKEYTLYARFAQVKGLNYGSEVSLAGLRAGTVKKISVENGDTKELVVELGISKEMQDRIREDSEASILTSGVLGDKYIEVTIGSPSSPSLQDGATIKSHQAPDFFSKSGNLVDEVTRQFQKGSNVDMLMKRLNIVAQNLSEITSDIQNSHGLYAELVRGKSAANVSAATDHLKNIMRKVDNGEGSLGALINDPTIYEDLKAMMGGAKRSSVLKYFMRSFIESGKEAQSKESTPVKGKEKDKE